MNQNPSPSRNLRPFFILTIKNPIPFRLKEALYGQEYRETVLICALDWAATFDLLSHFPAHKRHAYLLDESGWLGSMFCRSSECQT
jgi:hypothetical protein